MIAVEIDKYIKKILSSNPHEERGAFSDQVADYYIVFQ